MKFCSLKMHGKVKFHCALFYFLNISAKQQHHYFYFSFPPLQHLMTAVEDRIPWHAGWTFPKSGVYITFINLGKSHRNTLKGVAKFGRRINQRNRYVWEVTLDTRSPPVGNLMQQLDCCQVSLEKSENMISIKKKAFFLLSHFSFLMRNAVQFWENCNLLLFFRF